MKIAVVFEPDPDLGPDPLDASTRPRRLGEFIDSAKLDVLLVWREYGDEFEDGSLTHVISSGAWEHLTEDQIEDILGRIEDLD